MRRTFSFLSLCLFSLVQVSTAFAQVQSAPEPQQLGRCSYKGSKPSQHPVRAVGSVTKSPEDVGITSEYVIDDDITDPELRRTACIQIVDTAVRNALLHETHPACGEASSNASSKIANFLEGILCLYPRGECGHPALIDLDPYFPGIQSLDWTPVDYCRLSAYETDGDYEVVPGGEFFICKINRVHVERTANGVGQCGTVSGS